jgi:hypothetical protein
MDTNDSTEYCGSINNYILANQHFTKILIQLLNLIDGLGTGEKQKKYK